MRISFLNFMKPAVMLLTAGTLFTACNKLDVYEKNITVPGYQWQYAFQPGFDFEIKDTTGRYNIFIVLRHTDAYRYNNIWVNFTGMSEKKDTVLSLPHLELALGHDEKGWEGTGMDDIWEVRKPIYKMPVPFPKPGRYHFTVAQIMRENPLPNIMSVGVRVEKVK